MTPPDRRDIELERGWGGGMARGGFGLGADFKLRVRVCVCNLLTPHSQTQSSIATWLMRISAPVRFCASRVSIPQDTRANGNINLRKNQIFNLFRDKIVRTIERDSANCFNPIINLL